MVKSSILLPSSLEDSGFGAIALLYGQQAKTTPTGEYLLGYLMDFNLDHYETVGAVHDGANKILMMAMLLP